MTLSTEVLLGCRARVVRVVDGNALDIEMDLGSRTPLLRRCRLDGIDAPALDDPEPEEQKVAEHARDFVEVLVLGKEVVVHVVTDRQDEHGRWLAVVFWRDAAGDWSNLNDDLVENGLAASARPPRHGVYAPRSELLQERLLVDPRQAEGVAHCVPADHIVERHAEDPPVGVPQLPVAPPLRLHRPPKPAEGAQKPTPVDVPGQAGHSDVHRDDLDLDPGGVGVGRAGVLEVHRDGLPGQTQRFPLGVGVHDNGETGDGGGVGAGLLVELDDHGVGHEETTDLRLFMAIPGGLFYGSKLNRTLGGENVTASTPLKRVTVQANQFGRVAGTHQPIDAYLHGRVIQQVLSGNVTLAEAWWFHEQLTLNRTNARSAFLLDVTDEFYTMGFVPEVIALLPNATVANSGNYSAPPPDPGLWGLFFNAIAGLAKAVWDAAVAVAQFMINVVKFLVNIVVGLVIGLLTGRWTSFQDASPIAGAQP